MSSELLDRLAAISRQIEEHETARWLLEREREEVRQRLAQGGWKPPEVTQ